MEHNHLIWLERHTKVQQSIYKLSKGMFQCKSKPPTEEKGSEDEQSWIIVLEMKVKCSQDFCCRSFMITFTL